MTKTAIVTHDDARINRGRTTRANRGRVARARRIIRRANQRTNCRGAESTSDDSTATTTNITTSFPTDLNLVQPHVVAWGATSTRANGFHMNLLHQYLSDLFSSAGDLISVATIVGSGIANHRGRRIMMSFVSARRFMGKTSFINSFIKPLFNPADVVDLRDTRVGDPCITDRTKVVFIHGNDTRHELLFDGMLITENDLALKSTIKYAERVHTVNFGKTAFVDECTLLNVCNECARTGFKRAYDITADRELYYSLLTIFRSFCVAMYECHGICFSNFASSFSVHDITTLFKHVDLRDVNEARVNENIDDYCSCVSGCCDTDVSTE